MNGVLLVNKESNMTSRDMVNKINHIFDTKKMGHTGTLDPMATGLMMVCIGRYTKLTELLSQKEKEYIATIKLGIKTDTLDITGNIIDKMPTQVQKEAVEALFSTLKGKLTQVIPAYSAKKINGRKLYEYARNKEEIVLPVNEIEIYDISLISINGDEIVFKTTVSKGTYIRSLIEYICNNLGVLGTMSSLQRTKQGKFTIDESYTLEDIRNNKYKLLTVRDLLDFKIYEISDEEYKKVRNGCPIETSLEDEYLIITYQHKDIAIYKKENNIHKMNVMLLDLENE